MGWPADHIVFQAAFDIFAEASRSFNYQAIYGAFAAVPVFLLWLYFVWVIILCGAIFVRCLSLSRDEGELAEPLLIKATRILKILNEAHQQGDTVTDKEINEQVVLSRVEHEKIFSAFKEYRLLNLTEDERWVLGRSLKAVTLWDLYQRLPEGLTLERLKKVEDLQSEFSKFAWL